LRSIRPELPREFVAVHKRRRMIDAIAELTAEQGYEATKIADIVRRAGVARKTLYDNFDGKEDLFLAALDLTVNEAKAAVEEACEEAAGPGPERIQSGLAAFLRYVDERPAAARMCMVESLSATPAASARYDAALREFVELLKRNARGDSDLPETIEEALVGGVAWILHQQIRREDPAHATDLLEQLSEFILSPYHGVGTETSTTARRK
jgi:AcrR family transcriptional regulator